jgi:putative tryptophan/tyrosine transport system substrate-binding protein
MTQRALAPEGSRSTGRPPSGYPLEWALFRDPTPSYADLSQFRLETSVTAPRLVAIVSLILVLLAAPLGAQAQQADKNPRVALLSVGLVPERIEAFRDGLRQLGYVERQTVAIEVRDAQGNADRLPGFAAELVRLKIDVIVAAGSDALRAAQQATRTIPIVMAVGGGDLVASGLVTSLARPGGNITGLTTLSAHIMAKRLQLIKEAVPKATRVAVLWRRDNPSHQSNLKGIEGAAASMGVTLQPAQARDAAELDAAFAAMTKGRAGAVLVLGDLLFESQRSRIVDLAARGGLPAMYFAKGFVQAGGLMSYATDQNDLYRRAAGYVDKILKGAKPADLPVEQPTKFELVINLKTAKRLGLTIPPSVLARADEIIE